jgi:hypothetical protein
VKRTTIDPGLARGIRRGYLRRLRAAWQTLRATNQAASNRNRYLSIDTPKAFRRSCREYRERLGPLLSITELTVTAGARQGWVSLALKPELDDAPLGHADGVSAAGFVLIRPGGFYRCDIQMRITGHAVDRVIQRSGLVELPLADADIHAINAEFADAMQFSGAALTALTRLPSDEAGRMSVLLPSASGFFLGGFDAEFGQLTIRTFVDESRLWSSEREALRELRRVGEVDLALATLQLLTRNWMRTGGERVGECLTEAWRRFGWRLAEEGLPQGLSDRAWRGLDVA